MAVKFFIGWSIVSVLTGAIIGILLAERAAGSELPQPIQKCFADTNIVYTLFEWERAEDLTALQNCVNNAMPKEAPADTRSKLEQSIAKNCKPHGAFSRTYDPTCVGYEIELFLAKNTCRERQK